MPAAIALPNRLVLKGDVKNSGNRVTISMRTGQLEVKSEGDGRYNAKPWSTPRSPNLSDPTLSYTILENLDPENLDLGNLDLNSVNRCVNFVYCQHAISRLSNGSPKMTRSRDYPRTYRSVTTLATFPAVLLMTLFLHSALLLQQPHYPTNHRYHP